MREIENRKLALLTDYYELMMMQGFLKKSKEKKIKTCFDVFYRKNPYGNGFSVFCGLSEIIDYIKNLHFTEDDISYIKSLNFFDDDFIKYLQNFKFTGSIYAFEEGSIITKKEPILKVIADIDQAQLIEGAILSLFNHESLIATKSYRICKAAEPYSVMEFGLRRAHSFDAAIYGAKAACITGCIGTSNVLCGKMYGLPVLGTQAHSWIMTFDNELEAFRYFANNYPNDCILLVDTYDTVQGIKNAITVFKEMRDKGIKSKKYGVRLDSGDLAYLSKVARKLLDEEGFYDASICASNDLDENLIESLKIQDSKINLFGVGTKLITGDGCQSFGGVYKLSAIYDEKNDEFIPKIKISENDEKVTNPGNKEVYRVYNLNGKVLFDLLAFSDEKFNEDEDISVVDQKAEWKDIVLKAHKFKIKKMLVPIFENGKQVYDNKNIDYMKETFLSEKKTLDDDRLRLVNPKEIDVFLSKKLYQTKTNLLKKYRENLKTEEML